MAVLNNHAVQDRPWLGVANESDQAPVFNLRATLAAEAARSDRKWSLAQWFARMRVDGEWGNGNTLISVPFCSSMCACLGADDLYSYRDGCLITPVVCFDRNH